MKSFPGNFVDSIITDPPAGIEFMGKEWDSFKEGKQNAKWQIAGKNSLEGFNGKNDWFSKLRPVMRGTTYEEKQHFQDFICDVFTEAIRVIKPGGHALVWAIPRTSHHTAMGLERAGFEIRDCIIHMFGSGFPKSLNISKNIEKQAGIEMPIGKRFVVAGYENDKMIEPTPIGEERDKMRFHPTTDEGKQWEGWGTALKPACEFWWLARKPLEQNTIAENVLKWGTGGINIDECRIEFDMSDKNPATNPLYRMQHNYRNNHNPDTGSNNYQIRKEVYEVTCNPQGRFPANLIHDGSPEVLEVFPNCKSSPFRSATTIGKRENTYNQDTFDYSGRGYSDLGSASRFFKQCPNDNVYICPLCYDAYAKEHNKEWRNTNANNVEKNLTITQVITENFVQWNALEEVKLKSAQIARYVGNLCEKCGMNFVQELVVIKDYQEGSQYQKELQVMQDFIGNYKKCILLQNLVNYVEIWDSIDTTQITKNLLTLFGSANHVITNYIQKIEKSAPKRFVYAPKASKDERNYGCEELEEKEWDFNTMGTQTPEAIRARGRNPENQNKPMKNNHPTVKPLALMRYLCKLITPPNGIILDMFAGSGSTLIAARQENFNFIGIEKELDYINIAKARLKPYLEQSKLTIPLVSPETSGRKEPLTSLSGGEVK